MRDRSHLLRMLAVAALSILWLAGLGAYPLLESTEGRYASIAAAMARSGDFLEPRLNGLLHLAKPPLAYWAGALALRILPDGEFALRLPATIAWLLSIWLVTGIAKASGFDRRRALWAGAFAGLAPLAVAQGRMLSSDIFLWAGVLAVYYGFASMNAPSWRRATWIGLGLAGGFLAKGQMVLFWVLPPLVLWAIMERKVRRLALFLHPLGLVLFLSLAAPWFLTLMDRHPGLLSYWTRGEIVERYLTSVHGRQEPWWYFFALFPLSVLPWLPEAFRGVRGAVKRPGIQRLWLLWVATPLVLLSFSGSKRPNYILPLVAPLALLAAGHLADRVALWTRLRVGLWIVVVVASPFVIESIPGVIPPTRALIRSLPHDGAELVAYRAFPTGIEYYWGKPVAVAGSAGGSPFDPDSVVARMCPSTGDMVRHLRTGGLVLARIGDVPEIEELTGAPLSRIVSMGDWTVMQALRDEVK